MPPPRGGGALLRNLSDKNALSSASLSGQNANESLTPEEQLLNGTLELDPENDPVVFTTDYGLEIKSHNAAGLPDITVNDPTGNGTITVSSTTWNYISAGGYNWIIIGQYSSSSYSFNPSPLAGNMYSGNNPDGTDAGNAIESASENGLLQAGTITIPSFTNASVSLNGEIPIGCVLCLSASNLEYTSFGNNSIYYINSTNYSNLRNYIVNSVYGGTSDLSKALQDLPIVPMELVTTGSANVMDYLFPLGGNQDGESFPFYHYLGDATNNFGSKWWCRSPFPGYSNIVYYTGMGGNVFEGTVSYSLGVRPAFVLRLYG